MSSASSTQYFDTGDTYTDKHGTTQSVRIAYITYTPTDSTAAQHAIPLLLVQGWTGVKEDWYQLHTSVARRRPVLVFDNREMGQSTVRADPELTMRTMADDAVKLLSHVYGQQHKKFHVMGIR